jgi:hypothetical protein
MLTNTYFSKKWNELKIKNWHHLYFYRYMKLHNLFYKHNQKPSQSFLNFRYAYDFSGVFLNETEINKLMSYNSKVLFENYYDISCTNNFNKFNIKNLDTIDNQKKIRVNENQIHSTCLNLWSIDNFISIINKLKNKIDIINISIIIPSSFYHPIGKTKSYLEKLRCYEIQTYLSVVFALSVQAKNGVACIIFPNSEIQTTFCKQSISLINMYYENVNLLYYINNGDKLVIYAQGFKGITSNVQETLINNCKELQHQHIPDGKIKCNTLGFKIPPKTDRQIEEWNCLRLKNRKIYLNYLETIYPNLKLPLHHNKELIELLTQYQIRFYITWCKENMEEYCYYNKFIKNHQPIKKKLKKKTKKKN